VKDRDSDAVATIVESWSSLSSNDVACLTMHLSECKCLRRRQRQSGSGSDRANKACPTIKREEK